MRTMPERVPSDVAAYGRHLAGILRRHNWIVRHLLPAPQAVRALRGYFRWRLRSDRRLLFSQRGPELPKPDGYVKYRPSAYVRLIELQARRRTLEFFLASLRVHGRSLSTRQSPGRLWRAPRVLDAIGGWWIDANRRARLYVTRSERRAFDLCVRVHRLMRKNAPRDAKDLDIMAAALDWENRKLARELRDRRRRSVK